MQQYKRKGQPKGQNFEETFSKGQKKERKEKNSSSTQAKWGIWIWCCKV